MIKYLGLIVIVLNGMAAFSQQNKEKIERFQNEACLSTLQTKEIFRKIQVPPRLTGTSKEQLSNQIQNVLDALLLPHKGKASLRITLLFFSDNTYCIYALSSDRMDLFKNDLNILFENQSLIPGFLPAEQVGQPRDAESTIELQLKNGKIKYMEFYNLTMLL